MTSSYGGLLHECLAESLDPVLLALGFRARRSLRWRRDSLEVRAVLDSKAQDPYRGGAFTVELEIAPDGRFETKLAGRPRFEQLLEQSQRAEFLTIRNEMAHRLPQPPSSHLALIPEFVMDEYLRPFREADELECPFWMRFVSREDVALWSSALREVMRDVVQRTEVLDPHEIVRRREW